MCFSSAMYCLRLIVVVVVCGCGCQKTANDCVARSGSCGGYGCDAIWHRTHGGWELQQVLFAAKDSHRSVASTCAYGSRTPAGSTHNIPEGLFVDGTRIGPSATARVFVVFGDNSVEAIPLDSSELELLSFGRIDQLPQTELWKTKVLTVISQKSSNTVIGGDSDSK